MKKLFLAMAVAIVTGTAVSAQDSNKEDKIVVSTHQTDKADGYEKGPTTSVAKSLDLLVRVARIELTAS